MAQEAISDQIVRALDLWRDFRDQTAERLFLTVYGSPALQAAMGIHNSEETVTRKAPTSLLQEEMLSARVADLRSRIRSGGIREGLIRSALYVGMSHGIIDERSFEAIRRIRLVGEDMPRLTIAQFKTLVREQFLMLLIDKDAALAAIPSLLPQKRSERERALCQSYRCLDGSGLPRSGSNTAISRDHKTFDVDADPTAEVRASERAQFAINPDLGERAKAL